MAVFALSPAGQTYGVACREWGVDPGAAFDDEILGYNLQLALLMGRPQDDEPEAVEGAKVVTDLDKQIAEMRRGK